MRRVPTKALLPGMKVSHPIYNGRGEILLNRGVILNQKYIESLSKLGIPVIYIFDEDLPDLYVEDVIDERTRIAAINTTKKILKNPNSSKSPLNWSLLREARNTINEIIEQLIENRSLMVNMIDMRSFDDYLFAHSVNVCVLSLITGLSLGYDRYKLMNLGMGALMHDMGKTLIPAQILNKPGPLNESEFNVVKQHPEYGYTILTSTDSSYIKKTSALVALQHHERYNGEGYPKGLDGDGIHEFSQIVGMADVYDAMTVDRVYRRAHPPNEAYEMLAGSGDFFFNYKLVQYFLKNIAAYPAGSIVKLSSGETAAVMETPKGFSLYPRIKVLYDAEGNKLAEPVDIDMAKQNTITIVKVLEHEEIEALKQKSRG